jgi:hypothetical protein
MSNSQDDCNDKPDHIGAHCRWYSLPKQKYNPNPIADEVCAVGDIKHTATQALIGGLFDSGDIIAYCGPEGVGKTQFANLSGAMISNQNLKIPYTDCSKSASADTNGEVVFIGVEDDIAKKAALRICAAGASKDNFHVVLTGSFAEKKLKDILYRFQNLKLVIIDHWSLIARGYGDGTKNFNKAINELTDFARKREIAIIIIGHYSKAAKKTSSAIHRVDFPTRLRIKFRVAFFFELYSFDPETNERLFAFFSVKTSYSGEFQGLLYRIVPAVVEQDGQQFPTSRVELVRLLTNAEVAELTARSAHLPIPAISKLDEAKAFVFEALKDGPVVGNEVIATAKEAGISQGTLARARTELGVKAKKESGGSGRSVWSLPDAA